MSCFFSCQTTFPNFKTVLLIKLGLTSSTVDKKVKKKKKNPPISEAAANLTSFHKMQSADKHLRVKAPEQRADSGSALSRIRPIKITARPRRARTQDRAA